MGSEEERALENELESQLHEQRESLLALKDALDSDPTNRELLSVHEELITAIKDAEEGLLHLKRSRLLQEVDLALFSLNNFAENVKAEPLDPTEFEIESLEKPLYIVGSKCRFRYKDGRWYDGQIIELDAKQSAKVSFLTPTTENKLICKFFLQQRCRFGPNCRLSHGVDVPLASVKQYVPTMWEQSLVGSSIVALSDCKAGIWREAELESWDDELQVGQVVFLEDGSSAKLGTEAMSLSEHTQISDGGESGSSSEEPCNSSDREEEESPEGVGFVGSAPPRGGTQTETVIFAKWENHTRGIASKMMANMGYREGMGLGAHGQGMVDPILVKVLPPKQSLDRTLKLEGRENGDGKKRSRGGKRKREKKFAAAARAAKHEEESGPDVFSLINTQLAKVHGEVPKMADKKEDRRSLVAYEEEVKELRVQAQRLEEMANRNKKEKTVYEAAMRKLNETRKALEGAEAARASASHAVVSREKEKRWLKF